MHKDSVTAHNLDPELMEKLRARAAERGCSLSSVVRGILQDALLRRRPPPANPQDSSENLWESIRKRVEPLGGIELDLPTRRPRVRPPPVEFDPADPPPENLAKAIRDLVEPYGGFELELPARCCCRHD